MDGPLDQDGHLRTTSCHRSRVVSQTIYLPVPGLVPTDELTPGDLVGTNKDSYLILEKLPAEYDNRVKAMEVDEKPTEEYSDIGGERALWPYSWLSCSVGGTSLLAQEATAVLPNRPPW